MSMTDYKRYLILFVDDETGLLKYFEKNFEEIFTVRTAASVVQAWEIVEEESDKIGVVITDQRMPREKGVDLLERLQRQYPQIVRVLTTAFSDLSEAVAAVNTGGIFRYVSKPWNYDDLEGLLKTALEFHHVRRERDLLLSQKLSVAQGILTLDRVRGLAASAAALKGQLRNSLGGLKSYVEQAARQEAATFTPQQLVELDLETLSRSESSELVNAVSVISSELIDSQYAYEDNVSLADVLDSVAEEVKAEQHDGLSVVIQGTKKGDAPTVSADSKLLKRMLCILIHRIANMDGKDCTITIEAKQAEDDQAVCVTLLENGQPWSDAQLGSLYSAAISRTQEPMGVDMDTLAAFYIAHHHGGDIQVTSSTNGSGFVVSLASSPEATKIETLDEEWFDQIYSDMENRIVLG